MTTAQMNYGKLNAAQVAFILRYGFVSYQIESEADLVLPLAADCEALVRYCRSKAA